MQTFKGIAELSFRVVVPSRHIAEFRAACAADDASPFMKLTAERHPENNDAFMQAFISNAIRRTLRNSLAEELHQAGMGGTVSPVTIEMYAAVPDHDAPATPQVLHVTRADGCVDVLEPINADEGVQA